VGSSILKSQKSAASEYPAWPACWTGMRTIIPAILLALAACGDPRDGASSMAAPSPAPAGSPEKSALISKGARYSPQDYLVPGVVTILDFYADW
jgi:hypothetical protein